jgi:hypothetical protein
MSGVWEEFDIFGVQEKDWHVEIRHDMNLGLDIFRY